MYTIYWETQICDIIIDKTKSEINNLEQLERDLNARYFPSNRNFILIARVFALILNYHIKVQWENMTSNRARCPACCREAYCYLMANILLIRYIYVEGRSM